MYIFKDTINTLCSLNYDKLSLKQREHLGIKNITTLIPNKLYKLNTVNGDYKCLKSKTSINGYRIVCNNK